MPSPFPGMDPYLEDPELWRGVHHRLVTYIADTLSPTLPAGYFADIDERTILVQPDRDIYPDVLVLKRKRRPGTPRRGGSTAVADPASRVGDPPLRLPFDPVERQEGFIEIRLRTGSKRLVTLIEVLSPSNKAPGSPGREQYLQKQREVLESKVHLLEIDLLRRGAHTVVAPCEKLELQAEWDYLISLQRAGRNYCDAWPVLLPHRLPRVPVPLTGSDSDIELNLQAILDHCYDVGRYGEHIDYSKEPLPQLSRASAQWADMLLCDKGLRHRRSRRKGGRS